MHVENLTIYPIKSTTPHTPARVRVEPWGLADDRRWMVVELDGKLVTARRDPELFHVQTEILDHGLLRITHPAANPIVVDARSHTDLLTVTVWTHELAAATSPAEADVWFSNLLGRSVRLVWLDDPTRRGIDPNVGEPHDRVGFADGYPVLIATSASLRQLNDWITEIALERGEEPTPVEMNRFRANIVIDGETPFAEDDWKRIRVGAAEFRTAGPCMRCVLTTMDPTSLERGREPLRTLAKHRRTNSKVMFGTNLIPDNVTIDDAPETWPEIAIGDPVTIID